MRQPLFCVCGEHVWVSATRGFVAFVSPEDAEILRRGSWSAHHRRPYITRAISRRETGGKSKRISLHREILSPPLGADVDHVNRNVTDNRRQNLRLATRSQNNANTVGRGGTSSYKGVLRGGRQGKKWRAQLASRHLGYFDTEAEANEAYVAAAKEAFGEFARFH